MKNSIGNESHNDVRAVRNPQRINRSASAGIGVPCSAAARVHAINLFWTRQTTPQVFSSMTNPSPPPTLIARCPLEMLAPPFSASTSQEAAITIAPIPIVRTHTDTHHPNQRSASPGLPELRASEISNEKK